MILFFDTETTGLPKNWKAPVTDLNNWPRLVQLAYLVYDFDGNLIHSCNEIIKPEGFTIPLESSNVHGITTEIALQRGSKVSDVLDLFQIHLKRANLLVAHNMSFDEKIVGAELLRLGSQNIIEQKEKICTMLETIDFCAIEGPYGYKWPKLEELYRKLFGSDFEGAHDALADIQATAKCFWELRNKDYLSHSFDYQLENKQDSINLPEKNEDSSFLDKTLAYNHLTELIETVYIKQINDWKSVISSNYSLKSLIEYPMLVPPENIWFDGKVLKRRFDPVFPPNLGFLHPFYKTDKRIEGLIGQHVNPLNALNFVDEFSVPYFISIMKHYFKDMVFNDVGIHIEEKDYTRFELLPNILLYDKKTNLHIAINIDSPYDINTKLIQKEIIDVDEFKALNEENNFQKAYDQCLLDRDYYFNTIYSEHFYNPHINEWSDKKMYDINWPPHVFTYGPLNFFRNWFFIKFSEFQVLLEPHSCCKYIDSRLMELTGIKLSSSHFEEINDVKKWPMWTNETAKKLREIKFREHLRSYGFKVDMKMRGFKHYEFSRNEWAEKHDYFFDVDDLPF